VHILLNFANHLASTKAPSWPPHPRRGPPRRAWLRCRRACAWRRRCPSRP